MIDFTQQAMFLQSLLCIANTLMNALLGMIFPESVARVFRDFLIVKPSLRDSLASFLYTPFKKFSLNFFTSTALEHSI